MKSIPIEVRTKERETRKKRKRDVLTVLTATTDIRSREKVVIGPHPSTMRKFGKLVGTKNTPT